MGKEEKVVFKCNLRMKRIIELFRDYNELSTNAEAVRLILEMFFMDYIIGGFKKSLPELKTKFDDFSKNINSQSKK